MKLTVTYPVTPFAYSDRRSKERRMLRFQPSVVRQFNFDSRQPTEKFVKTVESKHVRAQLRDLCAVCCEKPARLALSRQQGQSPAKLCLRCHHTVMRHQKMLSANLSSAERSFSVRELSSVRRARFSGDPGLIIPRGQHPAEEVRRAKLTASRRRAQAAARHELDLLDRTA